MGIGKYSFHRRIQGNAAVHTSGLSWEPPKATGVGARTACAHPMTRNGVWYEGASVSRGKAGWGRVRKTEWPYRSATFHAVGATVFAVIGGTVVWAASRVAPANLCR